MGLTDPDMEGVHFVDVSPRRRMISSRILGVFEKILKACQLKIGCFEPAYRLDQRVRHAAEVLKDHEFSLIVANDINTLPLALMYRRGAKVLFDAHEYAPRQLESWFLWRFFLRKYIEYLCRTRIPLVDAMTTVGPAIGKEYEREFGVRPSIVLNAPRYHAMAYSQRDERVIRMIHHGSAARYRRLEIMIDAVAQLDERFRLDFMLVPGHSNYVDRLRKRAACDPRIGFIPPVSPERIVERIASYDVSLCTYAPHSFNARYALPNKFFDSLQARLCIAIGPLPEMKRLVERYDCGVVADDFTAKALAESLNKLDRRRVEVCRRAAEVAATELCYEHSAEVLQKIARDLLGLGGDDATDCDAVKPDR